MTMGGDTPKAGGWWWRGANGERIGDLEGLHDWLRGTACESVPTTMALDLTYELRARGEGAGAAERGGPVDESDPVAVLRFIRAKITASPISGGDPWSWLGRINAGIAAGEQRHDEWLRTRNELSRAMDTINEMAGLRAGTGDRPAPSPVSPETHDELVMALVGAYRAGILEHNTTANGWSHVAQYVARLLAGAASPGAPDDFDLDEMLTRMSIYEHPNSIEGKATRVAIHAHVADLTTELEEAHALTVRQSGLLTGVANAVHGGPLEDGLWSHHDLPECVADLRARAERAEQDAFAWRTVSKAQSAERDALIDGHREVLADLRAERDVLAALAEKFLAYVVTPEAFDRDGLEAELRAAKAKGPSAGGGGR